jgi:hypothetical protein
MAILLMTISGYFINGYCQLFHRRPLVVLILFVTISGYSIDDYYCLFY